MGTDIHGFVEQKIDGKWKLIAVETECSWCDGTGYDKSMNQSCYKCRKKKGRQVGYGDRCYLLFSILGNVRNYPASAFLSNRLGLPPDVSDELRDIQLNGDETEKYGDYDLGDHSVSWVTLLDLLNYDWNQTLNGKTYAQIIGHFCSHFIPALKALNTSPEDVRLVFGFDS